MLAVQNNIRVERRHSSTKATISSMGGMYTTKTSPKRRGTSTSSRTLSTASTLVPISETQSETSKLAPLSEPSTVSFPTPSTPTRLLFRTPITVTAGPQADPFPLHLEILLTCSPFFSAAYKPTYTFRDSPISPVSPHTTVPNRSSFPISPTAPSVLPNYNKLSLPTIAASDFEYFVQWLYTRTLDHEDLTGPHPAYFKLIRLYGVADQLQITALKNKIVDELAAVADATNSCPTPDDTRVVWDDENGCGSATSCLVRRGIEEGEHGQANGGCGAGAMGGGGIRELISDLFVWKKTDKLVAEHGDEWDERFLREVVVKLKTEKLIGDKAPWRQRARACRRYHLHDEWAPLCPGVGKGV